MKLKSILLLVLVSSLIAASKYQTNEKVFVSKLDNNWYLIKNADFPGIEKIKSKTDLEKTKFVKTNIPATVLTSLINAGIYKDVYFADNLKNIDKEQFKQPWWYVKELNLDSFNENENYTLLLEGINYQANVYVNNKLVADTTVLEGPFARNKIDITKALKKDGNIIAIQIYPPVKGDLTIGFVDWNPPAPDENMGLWRGVKLLKSNQIELIDPFVYSELSNENKNAKLFFEVYIKNHLNTNQEYKLELVFNSKKYEKIYNVKANQESLIKITSKEFAEFNVDNPKLWWPNGYGEQNLHNLTANVYVNNSLSSKKDVRFGIRKIEDYINNEGHRGYKINGKNILIKGAGWVDDLLLADSDEKVKAQLEYVKDMNHNTVRLEGFWGRNETIYNTCDELGLMIMIGWSCQWEWEGYCGRYEDEFLAIRTPEEIELHTKSYLDQVKWLRNNPSVFLWVFGSDKLPSPALEKRLLEELNIYDRTRPTLASCKGFNDPNFKPSQVSGPTGVKMLGPYCYVTPNYWYEDTKIGGAYGFNTETGPGPQVPPLESMKKMLPEKDLWPINDMWNYHNGRGAFSTLDRYIKALHNRYGEFTDVESFTKYSQVSNYEAMRPMFEAFAVNAYKSTGLIQWMLNSAWPETYWQLYDWYLMPNGAYYGSKVACRNLNLAYNYQDFGVYAVNHNYRDFTNLKAHIRIYDINSKLVKDEIINYDIKENSSKNIYTIDDSMIETNNYFVDLRIIQENKEPIINFYWLSKVKDVSDYDKSSWFYTANKSYADFKVLREMKSIKPEMTTQIIGNEINIKLKNNTDKIAFFIDLQIIDSKTQKTVLPHILSDNYFSLLPNEERVIKAKINDKNIKPEVKINLLNK